MQVTLDGASLTPAVLEKIVRGTHVVTLTPGAVAQNERAYQMTLQLQAKGTPIYGLNTGVGELKKSAVDTSSQEAHSRRLLRSHAGGAGTRVTPEVGRATLVVRANQLAAGGAGVSNALLQALVTALNQGASPQLHELGSVGTADLAALAELGLGLLGELNVPGLRAQPGLSLHARDGLMLMSSNAKAIAEAALCSAAFSRLLRQSEQIAVLSFEAVQGNPSVLDSRVHERRPHPGQKTVAQRLRSLLDGYVPQSPRLQDAFSFRCLPQVQGALLEACEHLERVVCIEMNAAAENAVVADDVLLAHGNFHGGILSLALDAVRNALDQVASLGCARLGDLLSERVTGLTGFLAKNPGPDSGLMILEYTANDALGELRHLANRATQTVTLSQGIENHASFVSLSARKTTRALDRWRLILAAELVAATRAFALSPSTRQVTGLGTRMLYDAVRTHLPANLDDRPLIEDLHLALDLIEDDAGWLL